MADYKELLRRAISALPENNGTARRAVYEKARSALVDQLRAIQPPLPARDITQHRLQLEDCIRLVEQEASEAVISLGRTNDPLAVQPPPAQPSFVPQQRPQEPPRPVAPTPAPVAPPPAPVASPPAPVVLAEPVAEQPEQIAAPAPEPSVPVATPPEPVASVEIKPVLPPGPALKQLVSAPLPAAVVSPAPAPIILPGPVALAAPDAEANEPAVAAVVPARDPHSAAVTSIEAIIAAAASSSSEAIAKGGTSRPPAPPADNAPKPKPRQPFFAPRREAAASAAANAARAVVEPVLIEPRMSNTALAQQPASTGIVLEVPKPVQPALSSVREVEVEDDTREAEGAIERAIETLDREARGELTEAAPETVATDRTEPLAATATDESGFVDADEEPKTGSGLTIFLVVFVLLLVGVGGAGFWAWREGYVDLDQMFGRGQPTAAQSAPTVVEQPVIPTMDASTPGADEGASGPGNTATAAATEPTSALEALEPEDRLEPTPEPVTPTGNEVVLPSVGNGEAKTEERLSGQDTSIAAADPSASVDPAVLAGNQSLLLEASPDGQGGAVPFSGTVDWTEGMDEIGLPTLIGRATIPARNLGVSVTIRKNSDPILPASHLMEITFDVSDAFVGGSIAQLAGVLLKNEELVPGTALAGAAARVIGNSFLFALSASPTDLANNSELLESRRWLDLAIIYGTGRNAILTLEKDDEASVLFDKALAAWAN